LIGIVTLPENAAKLGPYFWRSSAVAASRTALLWRTRAEVTAVVGRIVGFNCSDIRRSRPAAWT
jgi:hypothetical protein